MKTIYLEPDEEITSVVDMLTQTEAKDIALVIPVGAQLIQSSISLKLLKREADGLRKHVVIVTADELGQQIAEKVNFEVRTEIDSDDVEDFSPELVNQVEVQPDQDMIDVLAEDMEINQDDQLDEEKIQASLVKETIAKKGELPKSSAMADIVKLGKKITASTKKKIKEEPVDEPVEINIEGERTMPPLGEELETEEVEPKETVETEEIAQPSALENGKRFESIKDLEGLSLENNDTDMDEFDALQQEVGDDDKSLDEIEAEAAKMQKEQEKDGAVAVRPKGLKRLLTSKWLYLSLAVVIIAIGAVSYSVLPSAEVTINSKTERVTFDLKVEGSKDITEIDEEGNRIPIQSLRALKDLAREFPASGEKKLNEKARGTVTIYNEYSSQAQVLVATTRLMATDGKLFRTVTTVEIPGASVEDGKIVASAIDIEIEADESGEEYNVQPTEFTIPGFKGTAKYAGFYGKSKEALTGGSIKTVKVVTEEDLTKAEEILTEELLSQQLAKKELESQMPTDLKLIEGAFREEIVSSSANVEADAEQENFSMSVTSRAQALIFNEDDLGRLVEQKLSSYIEEGRVPLYDTQKIVWAQPVIDWEETTIELELNIQEDVAWDIDHDRLKNDLAGLDEIEARKYLGGLMNLQKAKVTFWPFWVRTMPASPDKIKIIIE